MAKHTDAAQDTKAHDAKSADHAEPKKGEVSADVHEVTTALRGDITKLAGPKADKLIGHWQTFLDGLGDAGTKAVAADLGKLKALVADKSPDGAKIGKALTGLGDKVAKLGEDHGGVVGTALKSLAGVLHKGGEHLTTADAEA